MEKDMQKNRLLWMLGCGLAGFGVLLLSMLLNPVNHYLSSLLLIVSAVVLYFLIVLRPAEKNWMDIRAVFTGVWLGTIGLATLRLTEYQEPWQAKTWWALALAYLAFQFGTTLGIRLGHKYYPAAARKLKDAKIGRLRLQFRENRLFAICVITTLIGIACFSINIAVKGFVPCFSDDFNAYRDFYTRFHVFSVASTGASGLCYYCIHTQKLPIWKKLILLLCIFYLVFLFPIAVVSRGVFVVAALSLTTTIFYLNKRKFTALVVSLGIILGVYWFSSYLRNYTDQQLDVFFEPAQITVSTEPATQPTQPATQPTTQPTTQPQEITEPTTLPPAPTEPQPEPTGGFRLSPKAAFLYSYLTVSHDNLNEAVKYAKTRTWGIRQMEPFNVILRSSWIKDKIEQAEYYQVNPYLNTTNLIGDFYYDFGLWGVVLCMLLWAVLYGIIQSVYVRGEGPFALLALGNTMSPVALGFFSRWMSLFSFWLFWGVALLFALAACITLDKKKRT